MTGQRRGSHYWELYKEAIKSWQYSVSDKVVYVGKSVDGFADPRLVAAESYNDGIGWIEADFILEGDRHAHYVALIGCFKSDLDFFLGGETVKPSLDHGAVRGYPSMFVDVTYLVNPPQRMCFEGISSVIWLKRVDLAYRFGWNPSNASLETLPCFFSPFFDNRPLSAPWNTLNSCQIPDGLVESRSHAVNGITSDQTHLCGDSRQLHPKDVPLMFYIVVAGNGIGVSLRTEFNNLVIKELKVMLRPFDFGVRVGHARHNAGSLAECGTIGA